jgi:hypothetical protein
VRLAHDASQRPEQRPRHRFSPNLTFWYKSSLSVQAG